MPWVYYWAIDYDTGKRVKKRRWVEPAKPPPPSQAPGSYVPPPPTKSTGKSAAQLAAEKVARDRARAAAAAAARRAAEEAIRKQQQAAAAKAAAAYLARLRQAKEAAEREAARKAYERAISSARKQAYDNLQRRKLEVLRAAGLLPGGNQPPRRPGQQGATPAGKPQPVPYKPPPQPRGSPPYPRGKNLYQLDQADEIKQAKIDLRIETEASKKRWTEYAYRQRVANALNGATGDPKNAQTIEELIATTRDRAKNGEGVNNDIIDRLTTKYEQHAQAVYDRYEQLVSQINAALDAGNIKEARRLYFGGAFKGSQAEFIRLFGAGKDPLKEGTYVAMYSQVQEIAFEQREWWKKQMKAALQSRLQSLDDASRKYGEDFSKERQSIQRQLDAFTGRVKGDSVIDHYETWTDSKGVEHSRPVYRDQTIEEQLASQQAKIIAEQQKLATQRAMETNRRKALILANGLVEYRGQLVERNQVDILESANKFIEEEFDGDWDKLRINSPQDLQHLADDLVARYKKENPAPTQFAGRTVTEEYRNWMDAVKAYESRVYQFFGSKTPEWWERLIEAPGISHGLSLLQAPFSAIGSGARALNASIFGESKIGGFQPDQSRLPATFKALLEAKKKEFYAKTPNNPRRDIVWGYQRNKLIADFLKSEAGQRWAEQDLARQREESGQQDLQFAGQFYGSGALGLNPDPGQALQALNTYGQQPFASEGLSLLASLFLDPLNAIPLKFTTYAARGQYALEASKGVKGLTALTARPSAFAKNFLAVDEGTLGMRKFFKDLDKEFKAAGLTDEEALDSLRERVVGITSKTELQSAIKDWMEKVGLDPRKVKEAQLFNFAEYWIGKEVDRTKTPYLTQADEINTTIAERIRVGEREAAAADRKIKARQRRVEQGLDARKTQGEADRAALKQAREAQKGEIQKKAAAKQASAATGSRVKAPPAKPAKPKVKSNPLKSGATDNAVAHRETTSVSREVKARPVRPQSQYHAADEFFKSDALGNRLPREFIPDKNYRSLVTAAKAGDQDALEQLVNLSRFERNRFRMEQEDLLGGSKKFSPTRFDFEERAGTVGDEAATQRLLRDKRTIRHLKRVGGAKTGRDYVNSFTKGFRSTDKRMIDTNLEKSAGVEDEFGDLRGLGNDSLDIGYDVLNAAENSLRGTKGLYETFTHDNLKFYGKKGSPAARGMFNALKDPKFASDKLTVEGFALAVDTITKLQDEFWTGAAGFRDGGTWFFEVFHQLRLAGKWDKLREFSDYMTAVLRDDPHNLYAWMWKAMEERSVLPYAMHFSVIQKGFFDAAEIAGMHPELAYSMIPNGYYARHLPRSFGLSPRLEGLVEKQSNLFFVPPKNYTKEAAKDEVTRMMHGGSGEPTRVVTYVAERWGDFTKGSEVVLRITDEMTHLGALNMGVEEYTQVLLRQRNFLDPEMFAAERILSPEELIGRSLEKGVARWGRKGTKPRPEYKALRDATLAAYEQGLIKGLNGKTHTLMLLAALQTNPDAIEGIVRTYRKYMFDLGGEDWLYANRFIRDLFDGEITTDITRMVSETSGFRPTFRDAFTGKETRGAFSSRIAMWKEFDFFPHDETLANYAKKRAEKQDELEREIADENMRGTWESQQRVREFPDYIGTVDHEGFVADIKDPKRSLESKKLALENFMRRLIDTTAGNTDQIALDEMRDVVVDLMKDPQLKKLIDEVQDELGLRRLDEYEILKNKAIQRDKLAEENKAKRNRVAGDEPRPFVVSDDYGSAAPPAETASRDLVSHTYDYVFKMSEDEWLAWEKARANRALRDKRASKETKIAARAHIKRIESAEFAIKRERQSKGYIPVKERARFQHDVVRVHGQDVEDLIAPRHIAPMVQSNYDSMVEKVRTYRRVLMNAGQGPSDSGVKGIVYKGKELDYIPPDVYRDLDQLIADDLYELRQFRANTRSRYRFRRGKDERSEHPLGKMSDDDPEVIAVKQKAFAKYYQKTGTLVSINAYDEARKVLWKGYVQDLTAQGLLFEARKTRLLTGKSLKDSYIEVRAKEAKNEARRQLGALAFKEMYGQDPAAIVAEFTRRYGDDGMIRHFSPILSGFQRRTLEQHVKHFAGVDYDDVQIGTFLQSANRPPFQSRELTRDFLTEIGAWAPRTAEQFKLGARSWSVFEEAHYWKTDYGEIPEWTDPDLLATTFKPMFRNDELYFAQHKAWGVFSRSQELALRLDGKTMEQIEKAALDGDPNLNIPGRREFELQRKYVIERFGKIISKDGKSLDEMPWLMYPDEYRRYLARVQADELPGGFIQSAEELEEVMDLIDQVGKRFWDKYMIPDDGGMISYHDTFRLASEIQAQLLAKPKWARRYRDVVGDAVNSFAWFQRWLVFSNPAFLATNAVDAAIKGSYYRLSRRGLFNAELARDPELREFAESITFEMLGWDASTAMYRVKQAGSVDRLRNPRGYSGIERAVDRGLAVIDGTSRVFPHFAGKAEGAVQLRLVRGMAPSVYRDALKTFPNKELARTATIAYLAKEGRKMWPTAGDGPLEQLWNRFVPFATYSIRNKVLFISEALAHPVIILTAQKVGAFVEEENLKKWEQDHPGTEMPEHLRRRIELPWAPGYFLDLSVFSDAARGLKPIFDMGKEKSLLDFTAQWVRVVNPGVQAAVYMLFNAFNLFPKTGWIPILDDSGFPTGSYKRVTVGWTEPWSREQPDLTSVFWLGEAINSGIKLGANGWTSGEVSQMLGQVLFFNAVSTFDKGSVYASYYFTLKGKSASLAASWLENTVEGQYLQDWFEAKAQVPRSVIDRLHDVNRMAADRAAWFHSQSGQFQQRVRDARQQIREIRDVFAAQLALLTPGSAEYRELKARMYVAINNVYLNTPELMVESVWGKSAAEWSKQLQEWETDKLMDDFMGLNAQRPSRANYDSVKAYNAAVEDWKIARQTFLKTYPQVAQALGSGRLEVDSVRDKIEKTWDSILGRISSRNEAIEDAKAIIALAGRDSAAGKAAQDRLDALYLQNELDFSLLERDYVARYFDDSDFERLPPGIQGPPALKGDVIQRVRGFLDFDRVQYEKALKEGRLDEFLAKQAFGQGMKDAINFAKGGDPFGKFDAAKFFKYMQTHPDLRDKYFQNNPGKEAQWAKSAFYVEGIRSIIQKANASGKFDPATFVRLLKQNPALLAEYFKRHPGKKEQWARTDAYIKNISVWGKLVGAGRFDEAQDVWDRLPQWVKDEYYRKHPEKRKKAAQTAEYLGYMKRWVGMFDSGDKDAAMKYFHSLPKWVKDRYYKAHPDKRAEFELNDNMAALVRDYFATDEGNRALLLKNHPELRAWLRDNASGKDKEIFAILAAYRKIPKEEAWLRKIFREKYPEIFSAEAAGERKLKRVFDTLAEHPEFLPSFQQWVDSIWGTYAEMLKHPPRPLNSYIELVRNVPARKYKRSLSAAEFNRLY